MARKKKSVKGQVTYTVELTEKQMRIVEKCTEFYFRLMMGQDWDFCDEIASINHKLNPAEPNFDALFDESIHRRDHLREMMSAFYRIAYEPEYHLKEKSMEMLIAEDIWDSIRCATGRSRWGSPLHVGEEPLPRITKNQEE